MNKESYLIILAENNDDLVYYSDKIYAIHDDDEHDVFREIWSMNTKEEFAEYKKLDDLLYWAYSLASDECSSSFDVVRLILCDSLNGYFGLSAKIEYDEESDELDYIVFDWRDSDYYFKFAS